jgi:hypothetical protein
MQITLGASRPRHVIYLLRFLRVDREEPLKGKWERSPQSIIIGKKEGAPHKERHTQRERERERERVRMWGLAGGDGGGGGAGQGNKSVKRRWST